MVSRCAPVSRSVARIFAQPTCHHRPEVYGGIDEARCADLLKAFFKQRRRP